MIPNLNKVILIVFDFDGVFTDNKVYVNVSMPHVLEDIQSELSEEEYDRYIADITNFLTYSTIFSKNYNRDN